jgi:WD40 repeat protein
MLQNDPYDDQGNKESIVFTKVDAKIDIYNIEFEKNLKRLPSNLRFVKKYIYYELLPKLDKIIEELELIKETPNYDEKVTTIRPYIIQKMHNITCFDLFDNHNIKHMRSNKIIYGNNNGLIMIYDLENNRSITEKLLTTQTNNNLRPRIDLMASSTVKYYDTYLSRIAISLRGDPNIQIYSFNHSFSLLHQEAVINLKEGLQTDLNIHLSSLICGIKFSKDSFYMSLLDYSGGVRIYKFSDIPTNPINPSKQQQTEPRKESLLGLNFQANKLGNQEKKSITNNETHIVTNTTIPILISYIKYKEPENYTILPSQKLDETNIKQGGAKDKIPQKQQSQQNPKKPAAGDKNSNNNLLNNNLPPDENLYNIKPVFDENNLDITPMQNFSKNHPFITFIQKKIILEEKINGGFSSCLITIGAYVSFYNTSNLKFISLYPYLTDNMKNIFKIIKTRGNAILTPEENMSITSTMAKKEKEYIAFIKSKLESLVNQSNLIQPQPQVPKNDNQNKEKGKEKIPEPDPMISITKQEMNFQMLFPITQLIGQKMFNSYNNLVALGMKDGSILIWDAELHSDKFFFQNNKTEIISLCIDENYLSACSLDGQLFVYDLIKGVLLYKCYHNPYRNYPIHTLTPFFPFMTLARDTSGKICVYNTKEKNKCGKINLENINKSYKLNYCNKLLVNYSEGI